MDVLKLSWERVKHTHNTQAYHCLDVEDVNIIHPAMFWADSTKQNSSVRVDGSECEV